MQDSAAEQHTVVVGFDNARIVLEGVQEGTLQRRLCLSTIREGDRSIHRDSVANLHAQQRITTQISKHIDRCSSHPDRLVHSREVRNYRHESK